MRLMSRWEPGARERLVVAAVDLFSEQGYDATTVAQIAERAGVTRSTFFRYFPDKRELLVAGQETLSRLLTEGIHEAPADDAPLAAVAAGLERASSTMGPINRELAPRLKAAVAASTELQERDALKSVSLAAAMTTALVARGVPDPTAACGRARRARLQARVRPVVRGRPRGQGGPRRLRAGGPRRAAEGERLAGLTAGDRVRPRREPGRAGQDGARPGWLR